jgi:predicted PurR-regulated permease PerM
VLNKEINAYLPFELKNIKLLAGELQSQTLSNTIGVPLIALIQGTAAGIGYWIFGLADPVFWGLVTAFASIIPIAGSTLVWTPASILIIATGNFWMGLGLIAYGVLVIINIDNIARFIIQKKFADVHPLITVFGVIIGLNLFGLPGLIFGPLMLSYFFLLIKIYRNNYSEETKHEVTGN